MKMRSYNEVESIEAEYVCLDENICARLSWVNKFLRREKHLHQDKQTRNKPIPIYESIHLDRHHACQVEL